MPPRAIAGILVGGASRRMGGAAKGLLEVASGEAIVDRWLRVLGEVGVDATLVGARSEYAPRTMLADSAPGLGPAGGVLALLERAAPMGAQAIVVACDMPHVSLALVRRLLDAPAAVALAPRRDGRWEPTFARYDAARALPVVREWIPRTQGSMQGMLDALGATELTLSEAERAELDDWDTREDMARRPV
jgi:molybdopterin-guanine dinucleotide biosynthesis protein A